MLSKCYYFLGCLSFDKTALRSTFGGALTSGRTLEVGGTFLAVVFFCVVVVLLVVVVVAGFDAAGFGASTGGVTTGGISTGLILGETPVAAGGSTGREPIAKADVAANAKAESSKSFFIAFPYAARMLTALLYCLMRSSKPIVPPLIRLVSPSMSLASA